MFNPTQMKLDVLEQMLMHAPPDIKAKIVTAREALKQMRTIDPEVIKISILFTALEIELEERKNLYGIE